MNLFYIITIIMPKVKANKEEKNQVKGGGNDQAENYEMKEEIQWILDLPDTCIGSTEIADNDDTDYFIYRDDKIVKGKNIKFIPGLYKIFDECIVNAADNAVRTKNLKGSDKCTEIRVIITKDKFCVENNGKPIPIIMNKKHKLWTPEMVFGHLRTSGNYKKGEKRVVGGKNGLGAKLAVIFSKQTNITIIDESVGKKYYQEFTNNMRTKSEPVITDSKGKNLVKFECFPEFFRFDGVTEFSQDMLDYLTRRVYDVSASSPEGTKVYLNDVLVPVKDFIDYVKLYENDVDNSKLLYTKPHKRWEVVIVPTDQAFQQVSFVNNIHTYKGGKHVTYVMGKIESFLYESIKVKHPSVKKKFIRNYVHVYVNCLIENPSFDSQTKGQMTTNTTKFGSSFEFSKDFLKKVEKSDIVSNVIEFANFRQNQDAKKTDGKKKTNISDIVKLDDAVFAGHKTKSKLCTLILTEGDSAKALAVSGLSKEQRKYFGIFPLKGKLLNVREISVTRIANNEEIVNLKRILGLQQGEDITDVSKLRYGKVCLMTDADYDGFHIKGLLMNLFAVLWKGSFKLDHFFGYIRTPIIKVTCGKIVKSFYTTPSFEKWFEKQTEKVQKKCKIKYYKGLGTSTSSEAKDYFKNLDKNMVYYTSEDYNQSLDELRKVFDKDKKYINKRKDWLGEYDRNVEIQYNKKNEVSVQNFINHEMIHFSNYDNIRSIPSVVDGLKVSQRKSLYGALMKNIKGELKIAQLAAYISENTGYHHGEMSLNECLVKMAQHFVGSNNINYFQPNGQFGTRLEGGSDHASPRYIFTAIQPIVNQIILSKDKPILEHVEEENEINEPFYYYPIIPMILVNGTKGIGTGYSTDVPSFNPVDIIKNIKRKLSGKDYMEMKPHYNDFTGKIRKSKAKGVVSYVTKGEYKVSGDKIHITELPVGTWTNNYKQYLISLIIDNSPIKEKNEKAKKKIMDFRKKQFIKSIDACNTDTEVDFTLHCDHNKLSKLLIDAKLDSLLKLESKISLTNMVLYNHEHKLHRYQNVEEIMDEFYEVRLAAYNKRVKHRLDEIEKQLIIINERIRFITDIIDGKIVVFKRSKDNIREQLEKGNFQKVNDDYKHLLSMSIYSFTKEKIEEMLNEKKDLDDEKKFLETTKVEKIWESELDELAKSYDKYLKWKIESNKNK